MLDKTKISATQFLFLMACFIQSSSLLSSFLSTVTYHESWLVIIISIILCYPFVLIYRYLIFKFQNKNFIQMIELTFGKYAGKIIAFCYVWFFIALVGFNVLDLANITRLTIMNNTPTLVTISLVMIVSAFAVKFGVKIFARYAAFFAIIASAINIVSFFLLKNQINLLNFLPLFNQPLIKYIQGTHIVTAIPFGEIVMLLMITPNIKGTKKQITRSLNLGYFLGVLTFLLVTIRDISILGNTYHLFNSPSLVAYRLVSIGEALSRIEILFVIVLITILLFKVIIIFYCAVMSIVYLFNLNEYKHIILITAVLSISYGITLNKNPVWHMKTTQETTIFVWTFLELFIPFVMFVIALFMKTKKWDDELI